MNPATPIFFKLFAASALLLAAAVARAGECQVTIEANDMMQFNRHQISVPASCETVELTLTHVGNLVKAVRGHDWVLTKSADVNAVVNGGTSAGLNGNFQSANDPRILAATKVVGGGESTTISFSTSHLQPGNDYTFFCTYPGHWSMMKGDFVFGERSADRLATTVSKTASATP
jgi:azurin